MRIKQKKKKKKRCTIIQVLPHTRDTRKMARKREEGTARRPIETEQREKKKKKQKSRARRENSRPRIILRVSAHRGRAEVASRETSSVFEYV